MSEVMDDAVESQVPILRPAWLHPTGARVSCLAVNDQTDMDFTNASDQSLLRSLCAFGTDDGKIKILDTASGSVVFRYESDLGLFGVSSVALSSKDYWVAAGFEDGTFLVFDFRNGMDQFSKNLLLLNEQKNDGPTIIPELSDEVVNGELLFKKKFPKQMVEKVCWQWQTPTVFLSVGKSVFYFDTEDKELNLFVEEETSITDLVVSRFPQHGPVVMLTCYGHLKIYQIQSSRQVEDFAWKGSLINLNLCPHKKYVVCGTQEQTIHIWNLKQKKDFEMRGFSQKVKQMSFREDGLQMAHGSGDEVILWDFSGQGPAGKRPVILGPHESKVSEVHFQNHGQLLASAAQDGIILLWSMNSPNVPVAITGVRDQAITKIQWTADDRYLFAGFATGYVVMIPVPEL
jgi:WD40 repeat protein